MPSIVIDRSAGDQGIIVERMVDSLASWAAQGAAVGGAIGTAIPAIGNAVGAAIGAVAGILGAVFRKDQKIPATQVVRITLRETLLQAFGAGSATGQVEGRTPVSFGLRVPAADMLELSRELVMQLRAASDDRDDRNDFDAIYPTLRVADAPKPTEVTLVTFRDSTGTGTGSIDDILTDASGLLGSRSVLLLGGAAVALAFLLRR